MLIFSNTPGVVGTIVSGPTLPFAVAIGGNPGVPAWPGVMLAKGILTGFKYAGESGLGLAPTLQDRIYVYVFNERPGEVVISGIAFAGVCNSPGNWVGFDAVYAYYERVRASTTGIPVQLIFGPLTTIFGFMRRVEFSLEDPAIGIGSFNFVFAAMPRSLISGQPRQLPWEGLGSGGTTAGTTTSG